MIWSKTKGIISAQLESQNKVVLLPIVNGAWVNIDGKVLDNLAQHISWLSQAVIKAQWVFFLKVLFSRISSPTCSRLVLSNLLGNTCQTKGLVLPSKSIFTGQHFFGTTENASTQPNPQAHDFFCTSKKQPWNCIHAWYNQLERENNDLHFWLLS